MLEAEEDAIPNFGSFSLEEDEWEDMLPLSFRSHLDRGRWICFRMEDPRMVRCKYEVIEVDDDDDGCVESRQEINQEFKEWQKTFCEFTRDGRPLNIKNVASVPREIYDFMVEEYNDTTVSKFDQAAERLMDVANAQTLCIYRFQAPLKTVDDSAGGKAITYDLPMTWESSTPEAKITVFFKVKRM